MAIRGFVLAKTGWTLKYINELPEDHLLFAYHYLKKDDTEYWERFGAHLGTIWDRDQLRNLMESSGTKATNSRIFVPLSLTINPDLPKALLGKKKNQSSGSQSSVADIPSSDGLNTGMPLPIDAEVINMATLPKEEFLSIIGSSGLKVRK